MTKLHMLTGSQGRNHAVEVPFSIGEPRINRWTPSSTFARRARGALGPADYRDELPAEIELGASL